MKHPRLTRPAAVALTVPEAVIDAVAFLLIGEGIELGSSSQQIALPMMGDIGLEISVRVIGATAKLHASDKNRMRLTVDGMVTVKFVADSPIPSPEKPIHVNLTALVAPVGHISPTSARIGLDLGGAEFISAQVIPDPDAAFDPFAQVGDMLFGQIGPDLFAGLASGAGDGGVIGETIDGLPFDELALGEGAVEIVVGDGVMAVGVPQDPALVAAHAQTAHAVHRSGNLIGVSIAGPAIGPVISWAGKRALGGTALPFDIESKVGSKGLSGRVRSARILPDMLPDLRPGLRSTLNIHHQGDHLLFVLDEAWVSSPLLPKSVNQFNRQLGALATSMAPRRATRAKVPHVVPVPMPGSDDTYPLTIASLVLADGRVDLTIDAGL